LLIAHISSLCAEETHTRIASPVGEFGIYEDFKAKVLVFRNTSRVPNKIGQDYGWRIPTKLKIPVIVREEITLPLPGRFFSGEINGDYMAVSEDRKTVIFDREIIPEDGYLYSCWTVVADDPVGPHRIKVFIGGKLIRTFTFTVE